MRGWPSLSFQPPSNSPLFNLFEVKEKVVTRYQKSNLPLCGGFVQNQRVWDWSSAPRLTSLWEGVLQLDSADVLVDASLLPFFCCYGREARILVRTACLTAFMWTSMGTTGSLGTSICWGGYQESVMHRPEDSAYEFARWWPFKGWNFGEIKRWNFALTIKKLFGLGRFLTRRTLWVIFPPTNKKLG